jgi:hypothetical protein
MNEQPNLTTEQRLRWDIVQLGLAGTGAARTSDEFKTNLNRLTELVLTGEYRTAAYRPPLADIPNKG